MQTVNQSGRPKDLEKRARILQAAKAIFKSPVITVPA